jgi:hypothetical protein
MFNKKHRIRREKKTVEAMVRIYCRGKHESHQGLCYECKELLNYAEVRLDKCPFHEGKTTCANCKVHCYKPVMRERIRDVMRYAGPRMTYHNPLLALLHFIDDFKKEPFRSKRKT